MVKLDVKKLRELLVEVRRTYYDWQVKWGTKQITEKLYPLIAGVDIEVAVVKDAILARFLGLLSPMAVAELLERLETAEKEVRRKQAKEDDHCWIIECQHVHVSDHGQRYFVGFSPEMWSSWSSDRKAAIRFYDEESALCIARILITYDAVAVKQVGI